MSDKETSILETLESELVRILESGPDESSLSALIDRLNEAIGNRDLLSTPSPYPIPDEARSATELILLLTALCNHLNIAAKLGALPDIVFMALRETKYGYSLAMTQGDSQIHLFPIFAYHLAENNLGQLKKVTAGFCLTDYHISDLLQADKLDISKVVQAWLTSPFRVLLKKPNLLAEWPCDAASLTRLYQAVGLDDLSPENDRLLQWLKNKGWLQRPPYADW